MNLPYFIARRYLFAKKSHNVINIISLISAIGIAIGTTALVVVMAVYNGFEDIVKQIYSASEADLVVVPLESKFFSPDADVFNQLTNDSRISSVSEIVEETVFAVYDKHQSVAVIKGVDSLYESNSGIVAHLVEGDFDLKYGQIAQAVVGRSLAGEMQIRPRFLDPLEIYFPERGMDVSLINPMSSLRKEVLFPVGIVSLEQSFDKKYIFVPIETARNLLGLSDEVSSLEIRIVSPTDIPLIQKQYQKLFGSSFKVLNRYQQNETVYKMMTYEKIAIYVIFLFIIIVVSCNVFGSLTMLIIEKKHDIQTLKSIGASDKLIKRIFILEGWLITFWGTVVGLALGVILCFIQSYFGVIKMPGNFVVSSYPVIVNISDVVFTFLCVSLIGFAITALPAWKILPKLKGDVVNSE